MGGNLLAQSTNNYRIAAVGKGFLFTRNRTSDFAYRKTKRWLGEYSYGE
jgi:hypothetical protein